MPYENISLYFKTLHVFGWALTRPHTSAFKLLASGAGGLVWRPAPVAGVPERLLSVG